MIDYLNSLPAKAIHISLLLGVAASAKVPETIHYQGSVTVAGEPFDGTGAFKFAIVDNGTENVETAVATATVTGGFVTSIDVAAHAQGSGYTSAPEVTVNDRQGSGATAKAIVENGRVTAINVTAAGKDYTPGATVTVDPPPPATIQTVWSNDGSSTAGGEPGDAVSLTVKRGIFSLALGDTALAHMVSLPAETFATSPVFLRIWFDGGGGFQELTPDQPLTSVPYALQAKSVADGVIGHDQIDSGIGLWTHSGGTFTTGNHVGIGTSSPSQALEVNGNVEVDGWMGTARDETLELRAANEPVIRIEPKYLNNDFRPNAVIGAPSNQISGSTTRGVTISGGHGNTVSGNDSTIGGGSGNTASSVLSTVGGGENNEVSGARATVSGGSGNTGSGLYSSIGGGRDNRANDWYSTVSGGLNNTASGSRAAVGGGNDNVASGSRGAVGGGLENTASGTASTVPGGIDNIADGTTSLAAGRRATANHQGAFVWSDSSTTEFASTGTDQFLIRAGGGVGIGTNSPVEALHVDGNAVVGGSGNDYRLGVGTTNPWNSLHVVSEEDQGPFRVAVGSNSNPAFRIYPHRGAAIGHSWNDGNVPERGLRVHGRSHFDSRIGAGTTDPIGAIHVKGTTRRSLVLQEEAWDDGVAAWNIGTNLSHLRFHYRNDVNSGSFEQRAWVNRDNGSWGNVSDERLKRDITYLEDLLPRVLSLKPATYYMKSADNDSDLNCNYSGTTYRVPLVENPSRPQHLDGCRMRTQARKHLSLNRELTLSALWPDTHLSSYPEFRLSGAGGSSCLSESYRRDGKRLPWPQLQ